ncbi:MAG: NAD-dependent succinate-semialdehyde dehydrogenase [Bdellovibrionales bacterium]
MKTALSATSTSLRLADASLLQTGAFINGGWTATGTTFAVTNPATGAVVADVAECGAAETELAIKSAAAAQRAWAAQTAAQRAKVLRTWYDLLNQHADDIAQIITAENGKPLAESRVEAKFGASFIEWYGEEAKRVYGSTVPSTRPEHRVMVLKQPLGVVGCITPWNFPFSQVTKKLGAALAAGCTVVLKPAEQTPLSALVIAELGNRAGLPQGVLNIVPTSKPAPVGKAIMDSTVVRGVSFTGSTEIGKLLLSQAGPTVKKMMLELGGNSPFIVFDDADVDKAVEGLMANKFRNAGQTCVCANRVFVHEKIYAPFTDKLTAAVGRLNVGDGTQDGVTTGPLIDQGGYQKVCDLVADALANGAKATVGGKPSALGQTFFEPSVIVDAKLGSRIANEEIFGPVAVIYKFTDEAAVVAEANNTPYGLAAYFYTRDNGRVHRVAEALEYGVVAVNAGVFASESAPFGGVKQSGFGKEGGIEGIDDFLIVKQVPIAIA